MNITYSTQLDFFAEAADLLTRARSILPDGASSHLADFPAYWEWVAKRYHLPQERLEEWKRQWIDPLTEAAQAGLAAGSHFPEDRAKFFFTPCFNGYIGAAHLLAVGRAFAYRRGKTYSQLSGEERRQAERTMVCSVLDMEGEVYPDESLSLFELLDQGMQNDEIKWFTLRIVENAERYLEELERLLAPVISALREKEALLAPLAEQCISMLREGIESRGAEYMKSLYHASPDWNAPVLVYPCLLRPGDYSYYHAGGEQVLQVGGITAILLPAKYGGMGYDLMLDTLKAIGDKRRMEILTLLRERPRYGQELAEQLSLTPATISHHMNALMQNGVINLEQEGNRIRYSLNTEVLEQLVQALRQTLLE